MTNQLAPLQCPSCGGLLRDLGELGVRQCAYCGSKYMMRGDEAPVPGLTRVGKTEPEIVSWDGVGRWKGEAWKQAAAMRGVLDLTGCGPLSEVQVAALKAGMLTPQRPKEVLYVTRDSLMRAGAEA